MRLKLGDALERREMAPHLFETPNETRPTVTGDAQTGTVPAR